MAISVNMFFEQMVQFFPQVEDEYRTKRAGSLNGMDTIMVEEVFMPHVIDILEKDDDRELLRRIFDYFELVATEADKYLLNVFTVTVLEILGNDRGILAIAGQYMGTVTAKLQKKADKALGREVD